MECMKNGRWEPFISDRLCLSKRVNNKCTISFEIVNALLLGAHTYINYIIIFRNVSTDGI